MKNRTAVARRPIQVEPAARLEAVGGRVRREVIWRKGYRLKLVRRYVLEEAAT